MDSEWDWNEVSDRIWQDKMNDEALVVHKIDTFGWQYANRTLTVEYGGLQPFHPNQRLLLETIAQLNPKSVTELGCGFGDNLYNLGLLLPDCKLRGYDISAKSLARLIERSPVLRKRAALWERDVAKSATVLPTELSFAHVVIMHILGERHLVALQNLFWAATKYVVLLENWSSHPFMDDIERLYTQRDLVGWKELHFYYRYSPELGRPHVMVISQEGNLPYEQLTDYDLVMRQPLLKALAEGRP